MKYYVIRENFKHYRGDKLFRKRSSSHYMEILDTGGVWIEILYINVEELLASSFMRSLVFKGDEKGYQRYLMGMELLK